MSRFDTPSAGTQLATPGVVQAAYFVVTGLWPILHLRSFEAISGAKVDGWLVKTFGGLVAVVGCTLAIGALERRPSTALRWLAIGSAATLATSDVVYVLRRRISPVYLVDGLIEFALLAKNLNDLRSARLQRPV